MANVYPYFPFYASDWMTDTAGMSPAARGIYITLLCYQWINGKIPKEEKSIARISSSNDREFELSWPEIAHKFPVSGNNRLNKRLEIERKKTIEISRKRSEAGLISARVRTSRSTKQPTNRSTKGQQKSSKSESDLRTQSQESEKDNPASQDSSPSQLTLDGNPDGRAPNCPHEKIRELYNQICVNLPRCKIMTDGRKASLRSRWKEHFDIDWWKRYFTYVHEKCPFLNGENQNDRTSQGRAPWTADFDWLLKPANMTKVIEEKYERR